MRFCIEDMTEVREFTFRGNTFKALCSPEEWHPSHFTFCDEVETREQFWNVQPGDVVLDVGADFGSYSLTALACGASRVVAWSPPFKLPTEAFEAKVLRESARLNGWDEQLGVIEAGLYSEPGWLAAFDGPRQAQFCLSREAALACIDGQEGHCAVFPVAKLDDYVGLLDDYVGLPGRCDWLKIDTENCEEHVLRGGEQLIRRYKPRILCEFHYHLDDECEDKITALLASWGYEMTGRRPHGSLAHGLYEVVK